MISAYINASIALFLYSYTQVDLSLTLSRYSILQTIEKSFQYVGFYQRPLSTILFILLVITFFILYGVALRKKEFPFWKIVIPMTILLLFSYPAFSYDIFNYMFDAKTILVYHKLPYTVTPLSFSGIESWLSFMHWTHISSTFPPFWILLTLPFYPLGFGYFIGIMWSFKLIAAVGYIVTTWCIWKILSRLDPSQAQRGTILFALNPLVMFESLVSGHNDIVMMAFAVLSFYVYLQRKRVLSFFLLSCSTATKLITGSLIPLFFLGWQRKLMLPFMLTGMAVFFYITKREFQPWYLLWVVPCVALLPRVKWLSTITIGASLGLLLSYAPFLYFGNYSQPVPALKLWLMCTPIIISLIWIAFRVICPAKRPQV